MLKIDRVTHWSIPVNDLEESERFYRDLLGMEYRGRLGNSHMACFHVGGHDILLCERNEKLHRTPQQDNRLHHSFTLSSEQWEKAVRLFHEWIHAKGIKLAVAQIALLRRRHLVRFCDCTCQDKGWCPGLPPQQTAQREWKVRS